MGVREFTVKFARFLRTKVRRDRIFHISWPWLYLCLSVIVTARICKPSVARSLLAAGREFTRGWAALLHEFAHGIEKMAKDGSIPAHNREVAHTSGKWEGSQDT